MKSIKLLLSALLVFSLVACSGNVSKEVHLAENYPRIDGSTANMPMMAEIRSEFLNEDLATSENFTKVTTTDYAWRNLINGNADLLLVYEPSAETKKMIEYYEKVVSKAGK